MSIRLVYCGSCGWRCPEATELVFICCPQCNKRKAVRIMVSETLSDAVEQWKAISSGLKRRVSYRTAYSGGSNVKQGKPRQRG